MSKNAKLIITISIILLLLVIVGASYAYFTSTIAGEDVSTILTTGGHMNITYADNDPNITIQNIYPREEAWATKDFTITADNTTDLEAKYRLLLIVDNNEFTHPISYSLTGVNTNNNGTLVTNKTNKIITGTTEVIGIGTFNKSNNDTHVYTLNIYYKEQNEDQNTDQTKKFAAHVTIDNAEGTVDSQVITYDNTNSGASATTVKDALDDLYNILGD